MAGFITTVIANLFHRPGIATLLLIISCLSLIIGCIIALYSKLSSTISYSIDERFSIRKVPNAFYYLAGICIISGLLFKKLHFSGGELLLLIAYISSLCGIFINFIKSIKLNKKTLKPQAYWLYIMSITIGFLVSVCIISSILFRILHYPGWELLSQIGFVLFGILLFFNYQYRISVKKKYTLVNTNTIEITPEELNEYIGVYYNPQKNIDITISTNRTQTSLLAQATNQDPIPLNAIEKNVFNYNKAGIIMEFKPEENKFILIQHGGYFPFTKKI